MRAFVVSSCVLFQTATALGVSKRVQIGSEKQITAAVRVRIDPKPVVEQGDSPLVILGHIL